MTHKTKTATEETWCFQTPYRKRWRPQQTQWWKQTAKTRPHTRSSEVEYSSFWTTTVSDVHEMSELMKIKGKWAFNSTLGESGRKLSLFLTYLESGAEPAVDKQRTIGKTCAVYVSVYVIDWQPSPVVFFSRGIQAVAWSFSRFVGRFFQLIVVLEVLFSEGQLQGRRRWLLCLGFDFWLWTDVTKDLYHDQVNWKDDKTWNDSYNYLHRPNKDRKSKWAFDSSVKLDSGLYRIPVVI